MAEIQARAEERYVDLKEMLTTLISERKGGTLPRNKTNDDLMENSSEILERRTAEAKLKKPVVDRDEVEIEDETSSPIGEQGGNNGAEGGTGGVTVGPEWGYMARPGFDVAGGPSHITVDQNGGTCQLGGSGYWAQDQGRRVRTKFVLGTLARHSQRVGRTRVNKDWAEREHPLLGRDDGLHLANRASGTYKGPSVVRAIQLGRATQASWEDRAPGRVCSMEAGAEDRLGQVAGQQAR
ncbi:unnamed protein product [Linum trigynum]|uniref:Uncharacterized protein n=1 Tax=Linum trigynum TaxID=586398 RepID=A0AAV2F4Q8_9ROSI